MEEIPKIVNDWNLKTNWKSLGYIWEKFCDRETYFP